MTMTHPIIFSFEHHTLLDSLCKKLPATRGETQSRVFPDGETYLRIITPVQDRHCIILADLSHPDTKYLPLVFLANTLREFGALSVGLIAPYLSYMRQDRRFVEGEVITSRIFAEQLSSQVDWLITIDPHIHRYHSLGEIYSIPTCVVQGAALLANWLKSQQQLFLVGPDAESEQWVSEIAAHSGHPFVVGTKERFGDRDVKVTLPDLSLFQGYTAVIVDDVISSGQTILKCVDELKRNHIENISCIAVHGIFSDQSDQILMAKGLKNLVTTNTIPHTSNAIDVACILVQPINECLNNIAKDKKS